MKPLWGDPVHECVHGARLGTRCPVCNPQAPTETDRGPIVFGAICLLVIVLFGRGSWQRETAFEDAQQRAHVAQMDPSVRQSLHAIAAEQRR